MGSGERGSPESHFCWRYTTPNEWKRWLELIRAFVSEVAPQQGSTDTRPFVSVTLLGRRFQALIDTGAMVDLIGDRVAALLEDQGMYPEGSAVELRMANGTGCQSRNRYQLRGVVGNTPHTWEAYHIPGLTSDLILGMRSIVDLNLIQVNVTTELCKDDRTLTERNPDYVGVIGALPKDESQRMKDFLDHELPLFDDVTGQTTLLEHTIRLKANAAPIKQRHYPRNPAMQAIINEEVNTMLRDGVIEPSDSPWSSPVVLIRKSTGKYRFCIDMRRVNDSSIKDAYPLPRINAILEKLRPAKFISTLDLKHGYWQVPLNSESRPITAFTVPGMGLFQFKVMPFGLHSAGATFQRLLDKVIGPELEPHAFAYLDDLIVVSSDFEQHLDLLKIVFRRLREAGLRLNPEKCHFGKQELKYLGHIVNSDGIGTDPEKVQAIEDFPAPTSVRTLRSFLGLASWYRRFIDKFATLTAPLRHLLKKNARWFWGREQERAFCELKRRLSSAPILACPDFNVEFTLQVDASNCGLGAALTQLQEGKEVVIAFASRLLNDAERNYSTTEKECLALVWAVRKFKPYLEGYHFTAITDHVALSWLMKLHEPSGRLARWIMELQQYDFSIKYRKGILNRVADALSRQLPESTPNETKLSTETPVAVLTRSQVRRGIKDSPSSINDTDDQNSRGAKDGEGSTPLQLPEVDRWYERLYQETQSKPRRHPNFRVMDGQLYRRRQRKDGSLTFKMCVPKDKVMDVLRETHDAATAGHLGVRKTIARVAEKYFWPNWRRHVKNYVRTCTNCQQYKVLQTKPAGKMHFRHPRGPWYAISADLVGPFPRSGRGHRFLVVYQDVFSKWTELYPIGSATAQNVVVTFRELLLRYGAPETIITDNGTQFISRIFQSLASDWGVKHQKTAPYSPQSNPVERPNRVLKTMISQFVRENHRSWDKHLKDFQFAMNTAEHESTGHTPAQLCFGRQLKMPGAIYGAEVEVSPDPQEPSLETTHRRRMEAFKSLYDKVRRNLRQAYDRQATYYNRKRREVLFANGDLVMRRLHVLSSAADATVGKLAPRFGGPCVVNKRLGENLYEVEDEDQSRHIVHVKDLKTYLARDPTST